MKMNLNLGVSGEALLKHPTACFRLSKAVTRVSDALGFGEFYLNQTKGKFLLPRDLDHVSTSINSSAKGAGMLADLVEDRGLKEEIQRYARRAAKVNSAIRDEIRSAKSESEPSQVPVNELKKTAQELRSMLGDLEAKVEDLCTVAPAPTRPLKVSMAGGAAKKRPIYPRYFVASMGRTRR